jgi:hypothetical protein
MIIKRKGERGSPWQIPREGVKVEVDEPLSKIEKKAKRLGTLSI